MESQLKDGPGGPGMVRRRTIVKGAAWSVPVIAASTALPGAAASTPACAGTATLDKPGTLNVTIPACATNVTYTIRGGAGGAGGLYEFTNSSSGAQLLAPQALGGAGATISGTLVLPPTTTGTTLTFITGDGGHDIMGGLTPAQFRAFGFGAGGLPYNNNMWTPTLPGQWWGAGGGGGSAILFNGAPVVVAGGGGGAGTAQISGPAGTLGSGSAVPGNGGNGAPTPQPGQNATVQAPNIGTRVATGGSPAVAGIGGVPGTPVANPAPTAGGNFGTGLNGGGNGGTGTGRQTGSGGGGGGGYAGGGGGAYESNGGGGNLTVSAGSGGGAGSSYIGGAGGIAVTATFSSSPTSPGSTWSQGLPGEPSPAQYTYSTPNNRGLVGIVTVSWT